MIYVWAPGRTPYEGRGLIETLSRPAPCCLDPAQPAPTQSLVYLTRKRPHSRRPLPCPEGRWLLEGRQSKHTLSHDHGLLVGPPQGAAHSRYSGDASCLLGAQYAPGISLRGTGAPGNLRAPASFSPGAAGRPQVPCPRCGRCRPGGLPPPLGAGRGPGGRFVNVSRLPNWLLNQLIFLSPEAPAAWTGSCQRL